MLIISLNEGVGSSDLEKYCRRDKYALIYTTPRFIALIASHLGARAYWLEAARDGETVGLLPFLVKDGAFGSIANSLAYYGSNGGVVQHSVDDEAKRELIAAFYAAAESFNCVSATIISNPLQQDAAFYEAHCAHNYRDERISQITHLPSDGDSDTLMHQFQDPRPRNIRRAEKAGVEVVCSQESEALTFLYKTHVENMHAIGGIPKRADFFEYMLTLMSADDWDVHVGYIEGRPVAALLLFQFNNTVEYFTPVVVESYRSTQALSLVIYRAMQSAMQRGYTNWNWGGTWLTQSGVYDFKKRWGTSEYRYYYYTRLKNQTILRLTRKCLLEEYPGFYVVPFSALQEI